MSEQLAPSTETEDKKPKKTETKGPRMVELTPELEEKLSKIDRITELVEEQEKDRQKLKQEEYNLNHKAALAEIEKIDPAKAKKWKDEHLDTLRIRLDTLGPPKKEIPKMKLGAKGKSKENKRTGYLNRLNNKVE
jgi:hypothetical protein